MTTTIFALATAPGRAAIAVVRLSGPQTRQALEALCGKVPRPRSAALRKIVAPGGAVIDRGMALWFPGPSSYTGEDCAELHLHGGPAVIDSLTRALLDAGLHMAAPGEFTRRAFENGKLDLTQAEAVADLIEAQTAAQARQAIGQLGGALGRRYAEWRGALVEVLADIEAAVDFPDEDIPAAVIDRARQPLAELLGDIDLALADQTRGQRVREGYRIAIIGAPNAGKSSLFNNLLARDAAIVHAAPGSTRDIIEANWSMAGYQTIIADMAGIRPGLEPVEIEGVRRARAWAKTADLRLWVVDGACSAGAWREAVDLLVHRDLCVINKADLAAGADAGQAEQAASRMGLCVHHVSVVGPGAEALRRQIEGRVIADLQGGDFPAATRARHAQLLAAARSDLARAIDALDRPELAADDVRRAARALAQVTGRIGVEDVLESVFASFCIGK
jgi:tRNA modification GTPase